MSMVCVKISNFAKIILMKGKENVKAAAVKPNHYKRKPGKLYIIIVAVLLAVALILSLIFIPGKNSKQQIAIPKISRSGPEFRKDGDLSILSVRNSSKVNLDIEISDDEQERMRGLMDRLNLPENAGMLFVFQDEDLRSFWMKNTFISLDIIYINADKEIVSIQKYTQPQTTNALPSEKPAKYVLEVNAGFSDENDVIPGDSVDFNY
jgi:uncharacterized protein